MQRWLAVLALCVLTLLVYSNSFRAAFVGDSQVLVLEDPRLREVTSANLTNILQQPYWWPYADSNLYRPLTTLSYLANYSILGNQDRPLGYHVVNLLLHTLNVLLLFGISRRLMRGVWMAFSIAAIWAVHPLATEAVTNIVGRADLLAAAGTLGALYAHMQASDVIGRQRTIWRIVTVAAATVAMFSKESGVAVIGVIVAYDLSHRYVRRPDLEVGRSQNELGRSKKKTKQGKTLPSQPTGPVSRSGLRTNVSNWLLLLIPFALLLYQRMVVIPPGIPPEPIVDNPIAGAGLLSGRLTALAVLGRYIWLTFWPATLSSDYSYAQIPISTGTPLDWAAWLTVLMAIGLLVLAVWRGHYLAAFAGAFAFVTFLPASNVLFPTGTIMAERLMYLPLAAVVIALVGLIPRPMWELASPSPVLAVPLILVAVLAYRSWERNNDWRDDVSIWTSAVAAAPHSFKAHKGLADAIYEADHDKRQLTQVIAELDKAIAILDTVPDQSNMFAAYRSGADINLEYGNLLAASGSKSDAERAYRRAKVLAERYLAIVRAVPDVHSTSNPRASKDADLADGNLLLSSLALRLNEGDRGLDSARRLQELHPYDTESYRLLSSALIAAGRRDEAAVALLTGITLIGDLELRKALVEFYSSISDKTCELRAGRGGQEINPDCARVHQHLCASAKEAAAIERRGGRPDHAEQLEAMGRLSYKCP